MRRIWRHLAAVAFVLGAMLLGLSWWIVSNSGIVTVDQALANLRGAGGAGAGGTDIVLEAIVSSVVVPLVLAALVLAAIRRVHESDWRRALPKAAKVGVGAVAVGTLTLVPFAGAAAISTTLSLPQYVESRMTEYQLGDYYAAPSITATPEGAPRNLVLIYLESVEDALSDTDVFERDMLEPITDVTDGWDSITLTQPANGGWTLGGIVNTQCGFPLKMADTSLVGNEINTAGRDVDSYLSGATCLGDVLEEHGYRSVFLGGANSSFAGKGDFLADHGYGQVMGRTDWLAHGETEMRDDWGLSDRRLIENAKDAVTELHESGEPFNLTLLTLDTHADDHVHPYCDVASDQALTSIHECSMERVAAFVDYMDGQGYLDDTVVVVMGDHLRITGTSDTFREQLDEIPERTIFNRIWSPDRIDWKTDEIDQLSMYPTLLELLGYEILDGRAGIGVSALEADPGHGTTRSLSDREMASLVRSHSQEFYDEMWMVEP